MSETPCEWKYLERRPGSSYQQPGAIGVNLNFSRKRLTQPLG
jgi:hypothetical protein